MLLSRHHINTDQLEVSWLNWKGLEDVLSTDTQPTRHIGEWKCPYVCGQALVNSVTTVLFALDMLRKRILKENNPVALDFISLSRKKQRQAPSLLQNSLPDWVEKYNFINQNSNYSKLCIGKQKGSWNWMSLSLNTSCMKTIKSAVPKTYHKEINLLVKDLRLLMQHDWIFDPVHKRVQSVYNPHYMSIAYCFRRFECSFLIVSLYELCSVLFV